jgi:Flp pilus assembly protein TadG
MKITMLMLQRSQTRSRTRLAGREQGSAVIELAMMTPLLVLLLLCAFDFGRVFHAAMSVSGAAHAGANYGAQSIIRVMDFTGMENTALQHAPGMGISASATRICRCAGTAAAVSCTTTCATPPMRVYASVTATRTFTTAVDYPGIPTPIAITRTAEMRAQ